MGCRGHDNNQGRIQRGVHPARAPPPKIGKNMIFLRKITIFHTKYPQKNLCLPPLGAIFLSMPPLTENPGSSPDDRMVVRFITTV